MSIVVELGVLWYCANVHQNDGQSKRFSKKNPLIRFLEGEGCVITAGICPRDEQLGTDSGYIF